MNFRFSKIPTAHYGAIAATLLLLAWSIDNVLQKNIAESQNALSKYENARLQASFQRSVLHYIADIRTDIGRITPKFPKDTRRNNDIPMEFQAINSGRIKMATDMVLRMQDFKLAAEIEAGIFNGMNIPSDIQSNLDNAVGEWKNFTSNLNYQLGNIIEFVKSVQLKNFGGRMPSLEELKSKDFNIGKPTQEDKEKLDLLFRNFLKTVANNTTTTKAWEQEITDATNDAAVYIGKRKYRLSIFSTVISVAYICIFFVGSLVSIIAAVKRGAA